MNLPALSRTDRLLLSILLLTAGLTAFVTWLVQPPEKMGGLFELPSSFFNAGYGTKAAYLALDRLGFFTSRLRRPIVPETLHGIGTLLILKPMLAPTSHELTVLEGWIKEGHALVVVPGSVFSARPDNSSLGGWFHLNDVASASGKKAHASVGEKPPAAEQKLDAAEPVMAEIGGLIAGSERRFRPNSPLDGPLAKIKARVFWQDEQGVVGLRAKFGKGEIIALADTYPFSNLGIGQSDNGLLLGNIVRELSDHYGGQVAFDEYHLGFPQRDWSALAMAKLMLAGPWRWAVGQTILVGLLALYAGAVRFGNPQDVKHKPRRQHREFAEAAGRLLDEAGATGAAAETLYVYYRDRLCRLAHLGPDTDDRRLAEAVEYRSGPEIAAVLAEARLAAAGPVRRQRLLAIFQKLHRIAETLDNGT